MIVWLDDLRNPINHKVIGSIWIESNGEFQKVFRSGTIDIDKNVEEIHLDHDLGNDEDGTGYDALLLIEEMVWLGNLPKLKTIYVHTSNPSAANKMMLLENFMNSKGIKMKRNHYYD